MIWIYFSYNEIHFIDSCCMIWVALNLTLTPIYSKVFYCQQAPVKFKTQYFTSTIFEKQVVFICIEYFKYLFNIQYTIWKTIHSKYQPVWTDDS